MLQVALRGLMAHKSRLITTFLAVSLGVAFVSGVLVLTDTVNRTFNDLFSDVYAETDAVVRSNEEIDQGFGGGEVRGLIDESLLDEVQDVDGVAEADVSIDGFARIIGPDGDPVGNPAMGAPTFGTNWQRVRGAQPVHDLRRRSAGERRRGGHRPRLGQGHGLRGRRHGRGADPHRRRRVHAVRHRPVRQRRQPGRRLVRHVDRRGGAGAAGRARQGQLDLGGGRGRRLPARAGVPDQRRARPTTPTSRSSPASRSPRRPRTTSSRRWASSPSSSAFSA